MLQHALQGGSPVGLIGRCIARILYHDMLIQNAKVPVKPLDIIPISREKLGKLLGKPVGIGPEADALSLEVDAV
jgi:hypothetical protein